MAEGERPGVERLFAFSDAVVAIAITLLVLPLADVFSAPAGSGGPDELVGALQHHAVQIGAFLLSFAIIARVWWAHHRIGEHLRALTPVLVVIELIWVLTVVIVPVTTAITAGYRASTLAFALYTGTLLLGSVSLTSIAVMAHVDERVSKGSGAATRDTLIGSAASTIAFALALVVGIVLSARLPHVTGYWALLLLAVTPPFERVLKRRAARRD